MCVRGYSCSERQEGLGVCEGSPAPILHLYTFVTTTGVTWLWLSLHWDGMHHSNSHLDGGRPRITDLPLSKDSPTGPLQEVIWGAGVLRWQEALQLTAYILCPFYVSCTERQNSTVIRRTGFDVKQTYFQSLPLPCATSKPQSSKQ